jgi:hypothetical protein
MGWAIHPVRMFSRREKYLAPDRIQTPVHPAHSLVTTPTKLPWTSHRNILSLYLTRGQEGSLTA